MKRIILILTVVLFGISSQLSAQASLNDYSFVIVPEEFSFLAEKDQFQLNSMTKYLFEKNGFNSYYQFELPDVKICDGLIAEVIEKRGFTYTTLFVVLKDCKGKEVYKSEPGRSKFKEFRKAYQDALRNAFKSVEALNFSQSDVVIDKPSNEETNKPNSIKDRPSTGVLQLNKYTQYSYNNTSHLLRKTTSGYFLYQDSEIPENGLIPLGVIKKEGGSYFLLVSDNKYPVTFKDNADMMIEKGTKKMNLIFQN